METTPEKMHKTTPVDSEKVWDSSILVKEMFQIDKKRKEAFVEIKPYFEASNNNSWVLKEPVDDEVAQIKDKQPEFVQFHYTQSNLDVNNFFTYAVEHQKSNVEKKFYLDDKSASQECECIVERAIEIITEWSETQDIKLQIQYAAVIVGKIENIKKKAFIQENEIRKKICTLLRTVIRLNVTDTVFTKEQLLLLKRGFLLLVSDGVQKEDMLQLARDFRREHLVTIPAWE